MDYKKFSLYWLPVIIYAAAIFVFSSQSAINAPEVFPYSDKLLHFLEYAIFGFLLLRALCSTGAVSVGVGLRAIAVILAVIYGLSDEIHQHFVPGRAMDMMDFLSDSVGALVGQSFYKIKE